MWKIIVYQMLCTNLAWQWKFVKIKIWWLTFCHENWLVFENTYQLIIIVQILLTDLSNFINKLVHKKEALSDSERRIKANNNFILFYTTLWRLSCSIKFFKFIQFFLSCNLLSCCVLSNGTIYEEMLFCVSNYLYVWTVAIL